MATNWCVDPDSGSDLNGGDSWTVTLTSSDGVANGTTTFTSATGGFTGKENRWMWIQTKNVRRKIVTVNSDTSVVLNATVVSGTGLTFIIGGAIQNCTLSTTQTAGDVIKLPVDSGQASIGSATWTNNSDKVTLSAQKNYAIDHSIFPWIGSANVTSGNASNARKNPFDASSSYAIAAGFTTGKVSYQRLYTVCTGGSASASTTFSGSSADYAFDNKYNTYHTNNNALPTWLKYDFGSGVQKTWTSYFIVGGSQQNYDPKTWKLQGSNNDTDWTDLDSQTGVTLSPRLQANWFSIASPAAYRYYRLYVTAAYAVGSYVSVRMIGYTEGAYDLSSYQQISLWSNGNLAYASGIFQIKLCSDTVGDTAVDTFTFPASTQYTRPMTLDKGSALGNNIVSIALYAASDPGTFTMSLGSIIACKAPTSSDCITFTSTISNGIGNMEYGIDAINGSDVYLADTYLAAGGNMYTKWYGTTGDFTTYVRQCIQCNGVSTTAHVRVEVDGTSGSPMLISGGWDKTSDTQTGVTWLSGQHVSVLYLDADYINVEKVGFLRGNYAPYIVGSNYNNVQIEGCAAVSTLYLTSTMHDTTVTCGHANFQEAYLYNGPYNCTLTFQDVVARATSSSHAVRLYSGTYGNTVNFANLYSGQFSVYLGSSFANVINISGNIKYSGTYALYLVSDVGSTVNFTGGTISLNQTNYDIGIYNCINTVVNNPTIVAGAAGAYAVWLTGYTNGCEINNLTSSGHSVGVVGLNSSEINFLRLNNVSSAETLVSGLANTRMGTEIVFDCINGDKDDNRNYLYQGTIASQTSVRHTASGIAWSLSPTSTSCFANTSISLPVASLYCSAGSTYTVTAYMRRSNTGLTCGIICPNSQLPGITEDKVDTMTAAADTWEQLSISFTPTVSGVAKVYAYAHGGTTYSAYIDDASVTVS